MKRFLKNLSLALALSFGIVLAACSNPSEPSKAPTTGTTEATKPTKPVLPDKSETSKPTEESKPDVNDNKIDYTVTIKADSGKPLSGFYVELYLNDKYVTDDFTGKDGTVTFHVEPNTYEVRVEGKDGYILSADRAMTDLLGSPIEFRCSTELIMSEPKPTMKYELGDVMYDFTLTDYDKNTIQLSELLKTKKVVILNFWVSACGPCVGEFPYVNEAYKGIDKNGNPYSDSVAFIAVNPTDRNVNGQPDSSLDIKNFKEKNKYEFDMYPDYDIDKAENSFLPGLNTLFNISATPVTVIIDRYANIAEIEEGAVPDANKWRLTFDEYISDTYSPNWNGQVGPDKEEVLPNVDMPTSDEISKVINGTNHGGSKFETTYKPETDSADARLAWPFVISQDGNSIQPSNSGIDNSFSIMHFSVKLLKDEVLAFEYLSHSEKNADELYVLVDGIIVTSISGISTDWENCFAFPAILDGTYDFTLIYQKDGSGSEGDDTVKIRNMRILETSSIDKETYIYREAASGALNPFSQMYEHYITPVFNATDGYYHVGTENGPLLLADLISGSNYSPAASLYELSVKNPEGFKIDGVNYADIIAEYAVYCSASTLGYVPVTKDLAEALQKVSINLSEKKDNPNQWLELCVYYNAYGENVGELESPIKGLTIFDSLKLDAAKGEQVVTIDRIIQTLSAYMFEFVPTESGVYKFYSVGDVDTEFEVYDSKGLLIYSRDELLRDFMIDYDNGVLSTNFVSYQYYEAGKTYYVKPRFTDIFGTGDITFKWEKIGEEYDKFKSASGPMFTTPEEYEGNMEDNIISIGVPVILSDVDQFYHVADSNAKDTFIYFDAKHSSELFGLTYNQLIKPAKGVSAFDFRYDDLGGLRVDDDGYYKKKKLETLEDGSKVEIIEDGHYVYEENEYVIDPITKEKIKFEDKTDYVKSYVEANIINKPGDITDGCVKVNAEFAAVLQLMMDKFTFEGVDYSWLKLCYYFDHVGPKTK